MAQGPGTPVPPDTPEKDPFAENLRRKKAVKAAFVHAWDAYKKYAWGSDEFQPLSKKGKNWNKVGEGIGLTILDSMDTLWIMDLKNEFKEAIEWIEKSLDFNKDCDISAFETTIRLVGGLLSAYELSGEEHDILLVKAKDLANRLLVAYDTPTGIPHAQVNLKTGQHQNSRWTGQSSVLSEMGTVQLEWRTLSYHTKDNRYDEKGTHIMDVIQEYMPPDNLPPTYFSTETAGFTTDHVTLGALGDSYYEYLLKQYLLTGKTEDRYLRMWEDAAEAIIKKLVKTSQPGNQVYLAEFKRGMIMHKMDHLACFAGGLFALASHAIKGEHSKEWLKLGKDITETCHIMYHSTATGLAPEIGEFRAGSDFVPGAPYYILRPETVESYFYLWRFTKEQKWRDYGWEMFRSLNHFCKISTGGFSGIKNVDSIPAFHDDLMQSFLLAETFKYLFLLFSDDDALDLDEWVLNTEAHPFRIRKRVPTLHKNARLEAHNSLPPISGYRLFRYSDAPNMDIPDVAPVKDLNRLATSCNSDPRCQGFNTDGYMKTGISEIHSSVKVDLYVKSTIADFLPRINE